MKLCNLVIIILSLSVTSIFASVDYLNRINIDTGGDMSGGGYILICNEGENNETIELLDYYEAKHTIRNFNLDSLSNYEGSDVFEKAISVIQNRLGKQSKDLTTNLIGTINDFKTFDLNFIERGVIVDISDADIPVGPLGNCKKKQIAVQVKNPAPTQYRVLVDDSLWKRMNEDAKIGLIMHEAFYRLGLEQGHKNSNKIRVLNSLMSVKDFYNTYGIIDIYRIFQYAEIDGCMNMEINLYDSNGLDKVLSVPVWISSFYLNDEYSGKTCKSSIVRNFSNGKLKLRKDIIVKVKKKERNGIKSFITFSNENATPSPDVNIERDQQPSYSEQGGRSFWGKLVFTNIKPYNITFAGHMDIENSTSWLPHQWIHYSNVHNIKLRKNIIRHAWVSGYMEFLNQLVDFESIETVDYNDEIKYFLNLKDDKLILPYEGKNLNFFRRVTVTKDQINTCYFGRSQKVSFKGKELTLKIGDGFIYNINGVLIDIKSNYCPSIINKDLK